MQILNRITVLLAVSLLGGCAHVSPRYGISANNVESLRSLAGRSQSKVSVSPFTTFEAGLRGIGCRAAGPVEPPDGATYEKYIEEAIISELKIASVFSPESPSRLEGRLDYITFNSNIGAGKWQIDMTFKGSGVAPFTLNTIHPFSTNFLGDVACNQVAAALPSAVQDLIAKLVAHPSFRTIVSSK